MNSYNRIILNIPHSMTAMAANTWNGNIQQKIDKWTDKFTDILFSPEANETRVIPIIFPYSRFYCDVERLLENEPLEAKGHGIFYTLFEECFREKSFELEKNVMSLYNEQFLAFQEFKYTHFWDHLQFPV